MFSLMSYDESSDVIGKNVHIAFRKERGIISIVKTTQKLIKRLVEFVSRKKYDQRRVNE